MARLELTVRMRRWTLIGAAALILLIGLSRVYLGLMDGRPRRYEIVGMALGAAAGLPLEYHRVRYKPGAPGWTLRLLRAALGTGGLTAFVLWDRFVAGDDLALGVTGAALATLWVVAGAPALFVRLRWGRTDAVGESIES